ncbi:MAG TPA: protein kinase [Kofleriaceae bacterium]|nr:protein kinase [Kofleriaceae bacterium]
MAIELDATVQAERPRVVDATATSPGTSRARLAAAAGIGPGSRLAHFRIERALGKGGMGEVWLATDLALDRPVAIKLLPADLAGDPSRRERLLREARAQARLNHPNVCHIYFIGEDAGQLFFAMEYVAGETLAQRLERGPLPADQAIELVRMAALGLREAHKAGFTHRDVKPSNLMIDGNGMLKVMDFGLVGSSPDGPAAGGDAGPTTATSVVGTPLYMAPEQGRGEAVDLRADVYALGATLHHMIAGAPPFAGESAAELLSRHETAARPPLATAPRLRRQVSLVDRVIATMMAKRPEDRFASYDALIDALDRASAARTRPAGFFVRTVAAFVDFLVLCLLLVPYELVVSSEEQGGFMAAMVLVLYPAIITRFGTTPGHALLDLEIVDHASLRRPRWRRAMVRTLVEGGLVFAGIGLDEVADLRDVGWLETAAGGLIVAGVGLALLELARVALRTIDKRTLWDRAAGTQVRYRGRQAGATS